MGVFKVWLGVALALAEFAVLPHHSEGERAVPCVCVCVRSCFLKSSAGVWHCGSDGSFLGRGGWVAVELEGVFCEKIPTPDCFVCRSQAPLPPPSALSAFGWVGGWQTEVPSLKLDSLSSHFPGAPEWKACTWSVGEE